MVTLDGSRRSFYIRMLYKPCPTPTPSHAQFQIPPRCQPRVYLTLQWNAGLVSKDLMGLTTTRQIRHIFPTCVASVGCTTPAKPALSLQSSTGSPYHELGSSPNTPHSPSRRVRRAPLKPAGSSVSQWGPRRINEESHPVNQQAYLVSESRAQASRCLRPQAAWVRVVAEEGPTDQLSVLLLGEDPAKQRKRVCVGGVPVFDCHSLRFICHGC